MPMQLVHRTPHLASTEDSDERSHNPAPRSIEPHSPSILSSGRVRRSKGSSVRSARQGGPRSVRTSRLAAGLPFLVLAHSAQRGDTSGSFAQPPPRGEVSSVLGRTRRDVAAEGHRAGVHPSHPPTRRRRRATRKGRSDDAGHGEPHPTLLSLSGTRCDSARNDGEDGARTALDIPGGLRSSRLSSATPVASPEQPAAP